MRIRSFWEIYWSPMVSSIFSIIKPLLRSLWQIMRETILLAKLRITGWVKRRSILVRIFYFDLLLSGVSWHFLFSWVNSRLERARRLHISDPTTVLVHRLTAGALGLLGPALAGGGVEHRHQDRLPEPSALPPLLPCPHWRVDIGGSSQIEAKLQDGHYEILTTIRYSYLD